MDAELRPLSSLGPADVQRWRALARAAAEPNPFYEPAFVYPAARNLTLHETQLLVVADGARGDWAACLPVVQALLADPGTGAELGAHALLSRHAAGRRRPRRPRAALLHRGWPTGRSLPRPRELLGEGRTPPPARALAGRARRPALRARRASGLRRRADGDYLNPALGSKAARARRQRRRRRGAGGRRPPRRGPGGRRERRGGVLALGRPAGRAGREPRWPPAPRSSARWRARSRRTAACSCSRSARRAAGGDEVQSDGRQRRVLLQDRP